MHTHTCDYCAVNFACSCNLPGMENADCGSCPIFPEDEFGRDIPVTYGGHDKEDFHADC